MTFLIKKAASNQISTITNTTIRFMVSLFRPLGTYTFGSQNYFSGIYPYGKE